MVTTVPITATTDILENPSPQNLRILRINTTLPPIRNAYLTSTAVSRKKPFTDTGLKGIHIIKALLATADGISSIKANSVYMPVPGMYAHIKKGMRKQTVPVNAPRKIPLLVAVRPVFISVRYNRYRFMIKFMKNKLSA
jgi:hypothetical protein